MDLLKYFRVQKYNRDNYNCWDFVRDIYKEEHNITLPELPIMTDQASVTFLRSNINYKIVDKAYKGCLIFFHAKGINHVGYAINEKEFVHKNEQSSTVDKIPQSAIIYEVLND